MLLLAVGPLLLAEVEEAGLDEVEGDTLDEGAVVFPIVEPMVPNPKAPVLCVLARPVEVAVPPIVPGAGEVLMFGPERSKSCDKVLFGFILLLKAVEKSIPRAFHKSKPAAKFALGEAKTANGVLVAGVEGSTSFIESWTEPRDSPALSPWSPLSPGPSPPLPPVP